MAQIVLHERPYNTTKIFSPFVIKLQTFIQISIGILIIIFVFEETIYGRLPITETEYLLAKSLTELFLYSFLILVMLHKMVYGHLFLYKPTFFDLCLVLFLCLAVVSIFLNQGSLLNGVLQLRTMLRYLSIYYIIILTNWLPTAEQFRKLFRLIVALAIIQSIIILLQHLAGDTFRDTFFSPPQVNVQINSMALLELMKNKIGAGYGTFGKTPLAAFFLLFVEVIVATIAMSSVRQYGKSFKWWFAYGIILIGIFFTYKRAALLMSLSTPLIVAWYLKKKRFFIGYLMVGLICIVLLLTLLLNIKSDSYVKEKEEEVSPIQSLSQLLSEEYWEIVFSRQRGWMLTEVTKQAFTSLKPIGYGADELHTKEVLAKNGGEFGKLVEFGAFEDVYIVANLIYYGPVGLVLLMLPFVYLYHRAKVLQDSTHAHLKIAGVSMATILILMFFSIFIDRTLEYRAFIFLFWTLAGIVVVASRHGYMLAKNLINNHENSSD